MEGGQSFTLDGGGIGRFFRPSGTCDWIFSSYTHSLWHLQRVEKRDYVRYNFGPDREIFHEMSITDIKRYQLMRCSMWGAARIWIHKYVLVVLNEPVENCQLPPKLDSHPKTAAVDFSLCSPPFRAAAPTTAEDQDYSPSPAVGQFIKPIVYVHMYIVNRFRRHYTL